jgi:hypothetical protein
MSKTAIEVITSVQRRRRWSAADKERLVAASIAAPFILEGKMPQVPLADVTLQQKDMNSSPAICLFRTFLSGTLQRPSSARQRSSNIRQAPTLQRARGGIDFSDGTDIKWVVAARCCADTIERRFGMSKRKRARTSKARSSSKGRKTSFVEER